MLERIALRSDLLDEVAAQAAAAGLEFEDAFARALARGLIRRLEGDLAPLLAPPHDDDPGPKPGVVSGLSATTSPVPSVAGPAPEPGAARRARPSAR